MGKIISLVNQKGGVGKTTTTANLSGYLAVMGKKVLLIDLDPQGNATSGYGIKKCAETRTINNVISGKNTINEAIYHTDVENLDIIPATVDLAGGELDLATLPSREKVLKGLLMLVKANYDYILIDCPPSLGLLTINALTASNSVIIPIQCEFYALEGLSQLMNTIKLVKKHLNPEIDVEGVVMTMKDSRSNLVNEVASEVKHFFGRKMFETFIPRNIRLAEAPSHGVPIMLYDNSSKGAIAYFDLAKEFLERNGENVENVSRETLKIKLKGENNE